MGDCGCKGIECDLLRARVVGIRGLCRLLRRFPGTDSKRKLPVGFGFCYVLEVKGFVLGFARRTRVVHMLGGSRYNSVPTVGSFRYDST